MESVCCCLVYSFFMSIVEFQLDGIYVIMDIYQLVVIYLLFVFFYCKLVCVVYIELFYINKCYMWDFCVVDVEWLYEVVFEYFRRKLRIIRN